MRKDTAIQQQVSSLQDKIKLEDGAMEQKTKDVLDEWTRNKPTDVSLIAQLVERLLSMVRFPFTCRANNDRRPHWST